MADNNAKKTTPRGHRNHNHNHNNRRRDAELKAEAAAEAKAQARMDARIEAIMASTERMVIDENKTLVALNESWVGAAKVLFEKVDKEDAVKALEVLTSTMVTMQDRRLDASEKALVTVGELIRDGAKAFAGLATMRAQQLRQRDAELESQIKALQNQLAAEQVDRVTEKLKLKIQELERELGYEE